ncbi:MAG: ferric reductase-like transmembrane domain-containing protein [Methylococcaceae bacterium]
MIARINKLWLLIIICLIPLCTLFIDIAFERLGSNPIQELHIRLGDWTLRLLWLTLLITPLQTITQWRGMAIYRQVFGLYSFFYASLHVLVYVTLDNDLEWHLMLIDIVQSPYVWFGVIAYSIILALGLTSSKYAKKRLGKNWKRLHRLIYFAAIAGMIHYFWQLKGNLAEPLFYLVTIILLLGFRVLVWLKKRQFAKWMIPKSRELQE